MNKSLFEQIYANLDLKETDELLEIWRTNNRAEWSDDAFAAIKKILASRSVDIPEQKEFVPAEEKSVDDELEDWEEKLLDSESQPELYDPLDVLSINDNINLLAKASIIVYGLIGVLSTPFVSFVMVGMPIESISLGLYGFETLVILVNTGVRIGLTYFSLKALSRILIILVEIEFNSRKRA
ncbi:MAG: hypothetical protein QY306_16430 [Anaerolineales bacterium]|nr:MAG: hypothetical protein QY306_16430 [Anaerolineales bacterium]